MGGISSKEAEDMKGVHSKPALTRDVLSTQIYLQRQTKWSEARRTDPLPHPQVPEIRRMTSTK